MMNVYPLKPVITTNPVLASAYNEHPSSLMLTSQCLTPSAAKELLATGVKFDTVVVVDGTPRSFLDQLSMDQASTRLTHMNVSENVGEAVRQIHAMLQDPPLVPEFFGVGGG